jgi:hypothetical protein
MIQLTDLNMITYCIYITIYYIELDENVKSVRRRGRGLKKLRYAGEPFKFIARKFD